MGPGIPGSGAQKRASAAEELTGDVVEAAGTLVDGVVDMGCEYGYEVKGMLVL